MNLSFPLMPQKILPAEILQQIFEELSTHDLFTCQSVCHSWHIPAKREFYKDIEFKTSFSINLFLTCISGNNTLLTLPPPGHYVKRLFFNHTPTTAIMQNFSVGSTLSSQHIQALAHNCLNVTTVDCTQNLNSLVVMGLLSLDEDATWKHLSSFPDGNRIPQDLYRQCAFKYRHSLTTLYFDMGTPDIPYLREFPCLTILDLSTAHITCIAELEYVLKTRKQLTQLVLSLEKSENSQHTQQYLQISPYPTLKLLKLRTDEDEFDHIFLRYIMYKFNQLVSLEMLGVDILDVSLKDKEEYRMLTRWMNSLKSSELVLRGHDYNMVPHVATEYLAGIFKNQLQRVHYNTTLNIHNTNNEMTNSNNTTFLVFSTMAINPTWMQRDIDIQLPEFETDNRQIHANYISQFAPYVNELFISYEGTPIYTRGCSYFLNSVIENCSALRSINVNYCELSITTSSMSETITEFAISNSQISPDFFNTLSFCCPNLKSLTLHRNFYSRNNEHAIFIDMPHTDLDVLALLGEVHFPWMSIQGGGGNNIPNWVIKIATTADSRERYFKIDILTSIVSEIQEGKQRSNIIGRGTSSVISIGIYCKGIKRFRISTSFADTTLDL